NGRCGRGNGVRRGRADRPGRHRRTARPRGTEACRVTPKRPRRALTDSCVPAILELTVAGPSSEYRTAYFDEPQTMQCGSGSQGRWDQTEVPATDSIARANDRSLSVTAFAFLLWRAARTRL